MLVRSDFNWLEGPHLFFHSFFSVGRGANIQMLHMFCCDRDQAIQMRILLKNAPMSGLLQVRWFVHR